MQDKHGTFSVIFFDICRYSEMDVSQQLNCIKLLESTIHNILNNLLKKDEVSPIVEAGDSFAIGFTIPSKAIEFAIELSIALNRSEVNF